MFNKLLSAIVCVFLQVLCTFAGPTEVTVNNQNIQLTLISIENKLRNIENTLTIQCASTINGKIEYYGRKIDTIEKDLSRFQLHMRMDLDRIYENISSKNYKDELSNDHLTRKIDAIYERINHKLESIEEQVDISDLKTQNSRDILSKKLEKIETSLRIRDADMEAELSDVVSALDELKSHYIGIEANIINNITKETFGMFHDRTEKAIAKQSKEIINTIELTNKNVFRNISKIQEAVFLLNLNTSKGILGAKSKFEENLNEYANKIIDLHIDLSKKLDNNYIKIQRTEKILNLTRNEQQNGLRALTVQVGKKLGKSSVQSDFAIDNQKLEELEKRIETNFQNVMMAQNLFLESCHRVQMDEAQLESQISLVLEKLIDIFENKTSVEPKDIQQLEHLIRTHDTNIRRSTYYITNLLLDGTRKNLNGKEELITYFENQKVDIEAIYVLLQEVINLNTSNQIRSMNYELQMFYQKLNNTLTQTKTPILQTNSSTIQLNNSVNFVNITTENSLKFENNTESNEVMQTTSNSFETIDSTKSEKNAENLNILSSDYEDQLSTDNSFNL